VPSRCFIAAPSAGCKPAGRTDYKSIFRTPDARCWISIRDQVCANDQAPAFAKATAGQAMMNETQSQNDEEVVLTAFVI
jgi:hypothetical protein